MKWPNLSCFLIFVNIKYQRCDPFALPTLCNSPLGRGLRGGFTLKLFVINKQVVRECIYATETILYIGRTFVSKQYIVYIDWSNFILGQPVN